jgi:SAM-dependent methyltransferase
MLDLGVGAGRTAYFAAVARSYVGLDYSPRMVARSRERIGESPEVRFLEGDARDLSMFDAASFDVVLFSFNGIDAVDHDDRQRILREVRRVLRCDGVFYFSSHSLSAFNVSSFHLPPVSVRRPLTWTYRSGRALVKWWRLRTIHRRTPFEDFRQRGWAKLVDGTHGFRFQNYYVMPAAQAGQLEAAGLSLEAVYDRQGRCVEVTNPPREGWLHYLCRPSSLPVEGIDAARRESRGARAA